MTPFPDPVVPTRRGLARIFREVQEETRILMRANWTCCSSCGGADLRVLADAERAEGRPHIGWAFYHQQAHDRVPTTGWVYLNFCAEGDEVAMTTAVGRILVAALERRGLFVRWSGSGENTIALAVDGGTFNVRSSYAVGRDGLEGTTYPLEADDGGEPEWFAHVWEEAESLDPNQRWQAVLLNCEGEGELVFAADTEESVLDALRHGWADMLDDLEEESANLS